MTYTTVESVLPNQDPPESTDQAYQRTHKSLDEAMKKEKQINDNVLDADEVLADADADADAQYRRELYQLIQQVKIDAELLAAPIIARVAALDENEVLTDEEDDSLAILNHVYYHCEVLLRRPGDPSYKREDVSHSADQLAILSQQVASYESIEWRRFGQVLGVLAIVAVIGVLAISPIGGVSVAVLLGGLALQGTALAIATAVPLAAAVFAGTGSFFAGRKSKQPTGLSKSILDVSKQLPDDDKEEDENEEEEIGDVDDNASTHSKGSKKSK